MQKNKLSFLFGFLILLASCSENDTIIPDASSDELVSCQIGLSVASMEGSISSRSLLAEQINDSLITNLWVLQFEDASTGGSGALLNKYYVAVDNQLKVDVLLKANATGKKSNLYFVANVSKIGLNTFAGDETAFKSAVQKVSSEVGFVKFGGDTDQTDMCIPMSGSLLSQTVTTSGIYGGINIDLTRMLARIDFLYSVSPLAAGKFNLKSVQICNMLNEMRYLAQENPADLHSIGVENILSLAPENATSGVIVPGSSPEIRRLTFFVPENLRGNGNNLTGLDKMKSGVAYATYFELYGEGVGTYSGEKFRVKFYPGSDTKNNYDIKRNTRYILNANLANLSLSDRRITKVGSNSYIVKPGESVSIPISRANESLLDLQIPDVYNSGCTASVYWESGSTAEGVVTLSNTNCNGGTFTVNGTGKGNAVVCIKNASGDILWSWHIWVSEVDFKTADNTVTTTNTAATPNVQYVWMDRNLGAIDLPGPGNTYVTTAGMYYQWGRKDPFMGCIAPGIVPVVSSAALTESYDKVAQSVGFTSDPLNHVVRPAALGANISKQLFCSVRSPLLFIKDWTGSTSYQSDYAHYNSKDPWGNYGSSVKTVYDPCPQGWRVPSCKSFTSTDSPWSGIVAQPIISITDGNYFSYPGFGLFPAAGTLGTGPGTNAVLWTAGASGFSGINNSFMLAYKPTVTNLAMLVRCVRE